jgi:hypothetical protein
VLPYLNSYNDPKIEKAYRRYLDGGTQRKIAKALKLPPRTLARYCKNDGWTAERKARTVTDEAPNVAAVAAEAGKVAAPAAKPEPAAANTKPVAETRTVGMERVLARQQRITDRLVQAYERDVDKTMADAETKPLSRSQIAQLAYLGNNLMAMERKAWCVPDKIETKDTTPTPEDRVRKLPDDDLERQLAESERAAAAATQRAAPAQSIN